MISGIYTHKNFFCFEALYQFFSFHLNGVGKGVSGQASEKEKRASERTSTRDNVWMGYLVDDAIEFGSMYGQDLRIALKVGRRERAPRLRREGHLRFRVQNLIQNRSRQSVNPRLILL